MHRQCVFEGIGKLTNEKVAVHAALFVTKYLPSNQFTRRTINLAHAYSFWIQRAYNICHECLQPIIGNHADKTGHTTHSEPNPADENWWQRVMTASHGRQAAEQELDPAVLSIEAGWEQAAAETEHDEEDFSDEPSDDVATSPSMKEN